MIQRTLLTLLGAALLTPAVMADDNIAACEIILLQDIRGEANEGSMQVASYRSAVDFIASVYDEEDGHIKTVDDLAIRGLICVRDNVIPTLRDFPIVATGVPVSLSQNFESNTSGLMTVYFKDGEFQHQYSGPDLTQAEQAALTDALETYNLQPHDLVTTPKADISKADAQTVDAQTVDEEPDSKE